MLTATQIVLITFIGILGLLSIAFMIAFLVEILREPKSEVSEENETVKSVFEININNTTETQEKTESVNEMLADLDKLTEGEKVEDEAKVEEVSETKEENTEEKAEEKAEETKVEETVQNAEVVEETKEETAETEEKAQEGNTTIINIIDANEPIVPGSLIDYETRLANVIEKRDKIEKELVKTEKSILKYERTIRRKDRNQKLLDRRAGELTNLNLLMYSVTDIKNVDEDKKVKQEELTAHIAELKASIQDAEEYIESNKSKYNHDLTVVKYLTEEKKRYDDEIAELESLIKAINEGTDTANSEN